MGKQIFDAIGARQYIARAEPRRDHRDRLRARELLRRHPLHRPRPADPPCPSHRVGPDRALDRDRLDHGHRRTPRSPQSVLDAGGVAARSASSASARGSSIGWLAIVTLSAILAPILPIPDPNKINPSIVRAGPVPRLAPRWSTAPATTCSRSASGARGRRCSSASPRSSFGLIVGGASRPPRRLLPRQDRHGPHEHLRHPARAPAARPGALADRGAVAEQPHAPAHDVRATPSADPHARHRVDPGPRPHHARDHAGVGAARVRAGRARAGRQGPADHASRKCCRTCCPRCSRSRCSASRS